MYTFRFNGVQYAVTRRDSQRARAYAAERSVFPRTGEPDWKSVEETQRYVNSIVRSRKWLKLVHLFERGGFWRPLTHVEVRPGIAARRPFARDRMIFMPRGTRRKHDVLHELAHIVCPFGVNHHWPFLVIYTSLISTFLGRDKADAFKAACKLHHVKYRPPRRMTTEAKRILGERGAQALAAWRAKAAGSPPAAK